MDKFHYGKNLRITRLAKGISQEVTASKLKISQATYSRIEKLEFMEDHNLNDQIAAVLDVGPYDLLPNPFATYRSGGGQKARGFLNTRVGMILVVGSTCAIIDAVHQLSQGICNDLGVSDLTKSTVKWSADLIAFSYIFYWVRKMKKMG